MKFILLLASIAVSSAVVAGDQFPDNQRAQARLRDEKERDAKAKEYRDKTEAQITSDRQMAVELTQQDSRKRDALRARQRVEKLEAEFDWKKAQGEQERQEKVAGDAPGKKPVHPCSYSLPYIVSEDAQDQKKEAEQQSVAPKKKRQVRASEAMDSLINMAQSLVAFVSDNPGRVRLDEEQNKRVAIVVEVYHKGQISFALSDFNDALHGVIETAHAEGDIPENVMDRYRRVIHDPIAYQVKAQVLEEFGYDSIEDADQNASEPTLVAMVCRMVSILISSHHEYLIELMMMKNELFRYLVDRLPQRVQAQALQGQS